MASQLPFNSQDFESVVQRQIPRGSRAWPRVESSNPRRPYKSTSAEGMEVITPQLGPDYQPLAKSRYCSPLVDI